MSNFRLISRRRVFGGSTKGRERGACPLREDGGARFVHPEAEVSFALVPTGRLTWRWIQTFRSDGCQEEKRKQAQTGARVIKRNISPCGQLGGSTGYPEVHSFSRQLQCPSLEVFKTQLDEAPSNLV